jgi:hypothetical protein
MRTTENWRAAIGFVTLTLLGAGGGCGLDLSGKPSENAGGGGGTLVGGVTSQSIDDLAATPAAAPVESAPVASTPAAAEATAAPTTVVTAEAGVGAQGRGYGGGLITEPIRQRFRAEQQIIFNQIKQAIDLYKATNGNAPRSHEEFMEQVVQANGIALPELPPGERYLYDPAREELMVERPQ